MKILVISDTHGYEGDLLRIFYREQNIDLLIHCGDVEGGERKIREMSGCPCYFVKGNNDYFNDLPWEVVINLGKYKAFVTHGHRYLSGFAMETSALETAARKKGAQIIMFGHTHYPTLEEKDGLTLLNPGSLTYPRQLGRKPSYMLVEVDDNGNLEYTQKFLDI